MVYPGPDLILQILHAHYYDGDVSNIWSCAFSIALFMNVSVTTNIFLVLYVRPSTKYHGILWFQKRVTTGKKMTRLENGLKIGLYPNLARYPYPLDWDPYLMLYISPIWLLLPIWPCLLYRSRQPDNRLHVLWLFQITSVPTPKASAGADHTGTTTVGDSATLSVPPPPASHLGQKRNSLKDQYGIDPNDPAVRALQQLQVWSLKHYWHFIREFFANAGALERRERTPDGSRLSKR